MMRGQLSRRRLLTILGAGAALGGGVLSMRAIHAAPVPVRWHGEVLGALSSMTLWHPRPEHAERTIARMLGEVDRLDRIFSLYRDDSELVRLNRDGRIAKASPALIDVFEQSLRIAKLSGGAFDPTIQPLWQLRAEGGTPGPEAVAAAIARVDYASVDLSGRSVGYLRPGMASSLNGIAQGYITDRISDLLANEGFEQAMIELGETRALGESPTGPFEVGIIDPKAPDRLALHIPLTGEALAVSGGYGLRLNEGNHIFTPSTGVSPTSLRQVAVISPRATSADALSTAIYVAGADAAPKLLAEYPGSRAILWPENGSTIEL